ncbi:hydantoinase B/oxoprolinase family protein [Tellurirhabdus bombi]|uniref:hydantoinase B/oxoprolinase family protein n=1 Tax=Tellurirhabdus bombi TaxID=2907205 RepID=UPI001F1F0B2E|nr:hydantoinase B/oxoprolinase family protein [Tellurirhabdus bombi]
MWQIWIDTGGTFTDGMAKDPAGHLYRTKVLSSSFLRGRLTDDFRVIAPWLTAPIFDGYGLRIVETGETATVVSLSKEGTLMLDRTLESPLPVTIELSTGEEAPVLATRLLTQTPLHQAFPPLELRLGTTRGTNALLERKGARVALLVTKGFKDLLTIGTQQRPNLFQLAIPAAEVLYDEVLEVEERIGAKGEVLTVLTPETMDKLKQRLLESEPHAVAISLMNAYKNPTHEKALSQTLREAGLVVSTGSELSPLPHYLPRTQTTVIDAYLTPVLRAYLSNLIDQLGTDATVRVMTSAGGLVKADLFRPKDSLLSGPAGGVIGSAAVAEGVGKSVADGAEPALPGRILTLDMGGTSTDSARYDGQVDYRFTTKIGPFELQLPSLSIETVAAGGGSVCWFDGVQLRVGPQSAGASPGPACYGANGPLTITDVNLLLGKLHAAQFNIPVFPEKAQVALEKIVNQIEAATQTSPDIAQLLRGFERIADEAMAGAIRKISVARGFDPKDYSLLVFGGAGGLHGCSVAQLLGISSLIFPFDGGLLSAYGIGHARLERMATRTVLQPLTAFEPLAQETLQELIDQATDELRQEAGAEPQTEATALLLYLRLQGQESSVEVPFSQQLEADFWVRYQQLYGHYPADRAIEVESVRVVVSTTASEAKPENNRSTARQVEPHFQEGNYPVYDWTRLQEGDTFAGPALLLNNTSSVFLEPHWSLTIGRDRNALAHYESSGQTVKETAPTIDSEVVQTELFTRRFAAIAEEMGAQLQRTAFSVNVKERLDFSCALLDADAELLVNAPHIPVHLGSLGVCARLVLEKLPLRPGDVIITNHPKYGGSHLPDVTLLSGVFTDQDELIGYVINRAHHAEIGGKVPGSMPPDARRLVEEGVVLEPQYVVKEGVFLWENLEKRFTEAPYPSRALAENRADIEAALASLRAGEMALQNLVKQHGLGNVRHFMQRIKQTAMQALQSVLKPLEGQQFSAEEALDDGHLIRVQIRIEAQRIRVDFSGTSPTHPHNLNANQAILNSALLYVLRLWCGLSLDERNAEIPLNEGLLTPVDLILPPSSFLNPLFSDDPMECPAVVGGNTEVSQRLVDTLLKALGLAACSQGTMNNFLFGNSRFGYYETIGGGTGAVEGAVGRSAVHQHMTNTKMTDPEEFERRYPVRLHRFAIRENSGGNGQWRGGDGIVREVEFLEPVQVTLLSQHRSIAPYGLNGGGAGLIGQQTLIHVDGQEERLAGIFTRPLQAGERIKIETPGGGGFGQ